MADELQIPPIGSFGTFDKPLNMPALEFPEFTPGQFDAPPPKVDPVDNLYRQITGQVKNLGTSNQWQGGALGELTFDGTARYMASILAERGITSIDQIGQKDEPVLAVSSYYDTQQAQNDFKKWVQSGGQPVNAGVPVTFDGKKYYYDNVYAGSVETGEGSAPIYAPGLIPYEPTGEVQKVLINKNTGQPLVPPSNTGHQYASSYAQPDGSFTWSGTYAGSGNTAFNLTFDEQGLPIFYTRGHSSSTFSPQDLGMIVAIGSLAFPGIGTAIGNFVASSVGLTVSAPVAAAIGSGILNTAITGDVKKGVLSAAGSYVGAQVAEGLGSAAADIFESTAGQNFVKNLGAAGARAAVMGEDVGKAIQTAATGGMFNLVATQIPGFSDIKDKNLKALISDSINTALNTEGDLSERLQRATLQGAISYGAGQVEVDGKKFADLTPGQKTLVTDLLSAELSGKPLDQALINSAIKIANSEVTKSVKQSPGLYTEPVLADEFGVSGREDGQLFASDIFPEVTFAGPTQPSQDFDSIFSESLQQPVSGIEFPGGQTIQFDDGSSITFDDAGEITGVTDSEGVELPLFGPPAVQEFNAPDRGPRLPSGPTRELFGPEPGGITFPGGETITFDDGSSITFGPTGEITSLIDSEGVEIPISGPTRPTVSPPEIAAPEEIPEDIIEPEEVIDPEEAERLAEEARIEEERLAEEARVTAEQERIAEEARQAEAERVANEERAQLFGFPNYATYQQFEGNYERYVDAQNELMAKGAEFPDYKTYMEYGGDLNAYEQDLLERDAIAAGFPDHFTQVQYGGSYDAYQADLREQARLEEESIAREEGFPDLVTKQQYNGDLASFKNDQAVAEGWPDAETKEEFGTFERYQQHLKDEADLEERGRLWEQQQQEMQDALNEELAQINGFPDYATYQEYGGDETAYQAKLEEDRLAEEARVTKAEEDARIAQDALNEELAQSNGFPDYATYLEFDGDEDAYLASLAPPVAEPEEPAVEPPYTPGEDAEEFLPPEVPYTPGEDAEEFEQLFEQPVEAPVELPVEPPEAVTPYTPGEDAEEFQPPVEELPPYTPGEDAADFQPPYTPGEDAEEFVPPAITEPPYTPGEDAIEFEPPYTPGEDAEQFVPPYTPGEDAEAFLPPYTPGEDAEEFVPPYTPGEDSVEVMPPYTPGEDAEEFIPPYTPGEDAAEFIPPYTPGEDAGEFIPPYTPGEDADEFEPEEDIDPVTGLPRVKVQPPPKPVIQQPPSQLPQPQANRQLDIFSLLGMLGMLGGQQQQQQPPKYEVAKEVEYTPWEQLYTPYSQDKPMSTEELIKLFRG